MRFINKFIGGCIDAMILAVAAINAVPEIPGDRLGTECAVCCDDDISGSIDDDTTQLTTPLN